MSCMRTTTSGGPTLAAEGPEPPAATRAGWSDADSTWEHLQERAAEEALAEGPAAARLWAEALLLAREQFAHDDPRLATSLANHARALRRGGDDVSARRLFDEALLVWDRSRRWIEGLEPERRARSSLFHLRLERKNREKFQRRSRRRYRALAAEGRAATLALRDGEATRGDGLARWRAARPAGRVDARKLLAAVLLIAP